MDGLTGICDFWRLVSASKITLMDARCGAETGNRSNFFDKLNLKITRLKVTICAPSVVNNCSVSRGIYRYIP